METIIQFNYNITEHQGKLIIDVINNPRGVYWLQANGTRLHNRFKLDIEKFQEFGDLCESYKETFECSKNANDLITKYKEDKAKLDNIFDIPRYNDYDGLVSLHLKDYQTQGIKFLELTEGMGFNCDVPGAGKTIQFITYCEFMKFSTVVIICNATLRPNWARLIKEYTGQTVCSHYGTSPSLEAIKDFKSGQYRYHLFHYDMFSRPEKDDEGNDFSKWVAILNIMKPDIVGMDECHAIKNVGSGRSKSLRELKVKRFVGLSGTPILNRPQEYWPALHIMNPVRWNSYEYFLNRYTYGGKTPRNSEELRKLLKRFMIRRDHKDIFKELPPINRIPKYFDLTPKAKKFYNKVLNGIYEEMKEWKSGSEGNETSIFSILAQITHMKKICAIDMMDNCADLATELYDSHDKDDKHKKVIIFSQFVPVVNGIRKRLGNEAISFTGIDDISERDRLIQEFMKDDSKHFLVVTQQSCKEGHTITIAGHVIFADLFWTPAAHEQAEGRAYGRINDPHPIDSYYMISNDTIVTWILDMLIEKQDTINEVVDSVNVQRKHVNVTKDLINMIYQNKFKMGMR